MLDLVNVVLNRNHVIIWNANWINIIYIHIRGYHISSTWIFHSWSLRRWSSSTRRIITGIPVQIPPCRRSCGEERPPLHLGCNFGSLNFVNMPIRVACFQPILQLFKFRLNEITTFFVCIAWVVIRLEFSFSGLFEDRRTWDRPYQN